MGGPFLDSNSGRPACYRRAGHLVVALGQLLVLAVRDPRNAASLRRRPAHDRNHTAAGQSFLTR
jgi:hypothetical protein